jgi:hypothetical protein
MLAPKGFKMSHEQIGTGKPAIVFVYDSNLSVSIKQSEEMNKARDQLGDQALFIFVKTGTPEGDELIAKHSAKSTEILLFNPSGILLKRQYALKNAKELVQLINTLSPN